MQSKLEASGLEVVDFDRREGGYRIRLSADHFEQRRPVLREFIELAYRNQAA